jgi:DDE superfamily endonuclease
MFSLPSAFVPLILAFAPVFFPRTWQQAQVLLVGAILAPGKRTVTAVWRLLGLGRKRRFQSYYPVLNRARWSSRTASRILWQVLGSTFVPTGPLVLGIADTVERRRGKRIHAQGIYRDPVRRWHSPFVKASGLRWMSLML